MISARRSGKVKAIVQGVGTQVIFIALVARSFAPDSEFFEAIPWWTMLVITLVTLGSFVDYYVGNLHLLRDAWFDTPSSD